MSLSLKLAASWRIPSLPPSNHRFSHTRHGIIPFPSCLAKLKNTHLSQSHRRRPCSSNGNDSAYGQSEAYNNEVPYVLFIVDVAFFGDEMSSLQQLCLFLLSKCRSLKSAKQIHAHVYKNGLDTDPLVAGKLLLCAVSISNALHYARCLLQQFPNPDAFMYNTLIRGLAESETPSDSLHTFVKMRRQSIVLPDSFSFAFTLKAVANCRSLRAGLQLHGQALCHGLDSHIFVGTTLISMYAECGNVHSTRQVFEEMSDPNVVTWNAVVTASFRCGDMEGAEHMFKRMPIRNLTSWNVMLAGYTKAVSAEKEQIEKGGSLNGILKRLRRYGVSGILSYGLLNTAYYLTTFLFVWLYIAPSPGKMGYLAAVERFLKVMAMVWAGSQVTKLIRAGGALALAPFVDRGLSWFTVKFKFESQGKAFMAIVGFCFGLAVILFLVITLLWA
ncbi:hypothetical protein L6164_023219 [Bauhinia variegata]|uniref:Uncharacterized protein n=1 Tax=Bauhinia variegata TaxID=167791 RepID=A0ACB9MIX1_BAUVA|nr:hypothetical protein L6164_023219 [Bauhinia variegata]